MVIGTIKPSQSREESLIYKSYRKAKWDRMRPGISIDANVFVPLHIGHSTVFRYDALWAFPANVNHQRLQNLWWSMAVQRLLWLTNHRVFIAAVPYVEYDIQTAEDSGNITSRLNEYMSFLSTWQCRNTFLECAKLLINLLYINSYLKKDDFILMIAWFNHLESVRYKWPNTTGRNVRSHADTLSYVQLTSSPVKKPRICPVKNCLSSEDANSYRSIFQNSNFFQANSDMILVIEFNHPTYHAIPYIEYIYRPAFKHIFYCGPKKLDTKRNINFLTFNGQDNGVLFYSCAALVMQMKFKAKGYILISDDVIINLRGWNLVDKGRTALTYADTDGIRLYDSQTVNRCLPDIWTCTSPTHWPWIRTYEKKLKALIADINNLTISDLDFRKGFDRMKKYYGGELRVLSAYSDMFYIPQSLANQFIKFSRIFEKHKMFIEIAVPTIVGYISNPNDIQLEKAIQMPYDYSRDKPWLRWKNMKNSAQYMYIHPVKLGNIAQNNSDMIKLYCKSIIPEMIGILSNKTKNYLKRAQLQHAMPTWNDVLYILY